MLRYDLTVYAKSSYLVAKVKVICVNGKIMFFHS